jgi:hypothetical protein
MAFARVETSILNHRKFGPLIRTDVRANGGLAALGLWTLGLAYSMDQLTDGRVPKAWVLQRLRPNIAESSAEQLCGLGLWEDRGDYWQIHDYLEFNLSSKQIKTEREAAKARMRKRRGLPPRSPEQPEAFDRNHNSVLGQEVEVEVEVEDKPPRTASPVRPNSKKTAPQSDGLGRRLENHHYHFDGCPKTEYLDQLPEHERRQCRAHRVQS